MEHDVLVAQQFGATAQAYLESVTHATGDDLELLSHEVATVPQARVLDLGCGEGHASFAVAPSAASVTAYDMTAEMLAVVQREATARGFGNIATVQGMAEALPFPESHFDFVISRYSAHHWRDVAAALREVRRVLKGGWTCSADRHRGRRDPAAGHTFTSSRNPSRSITYPRLLHARVADPFQGGRIQRNTTQAVAVAD